MTSERYVVVAVPHEKRGIHAALTRRTRGATIESHSKGAVTFDASAQTIWCTRRRAAAVREPLMQSKNTFDVSRRYVRFIGISSNGYVHFDFSIGDPELSVELTMKLKDYEEFCRSSDVQYLTEEQEQVVDEQKTKWRYGVPGLYE
jgi:phenol hydroxylase P0 protein